MLRLLGYSDRRPYLRLVDVERRTVEPVGVTEIPQGIDELVPIGGVLAVRCGPAWLGLASDLTGELRPLSVDEKSEAARKSNQIGVVRSGSGTADEAWSVSVRGGSVELPRGTVVHWGDPGTVSPDGRTVALGGCTTPDASVPPGWDAPYEPKRWVLVLIDVESGTTRQCDGEFEGTNYPPTWTADSSTVVLGAAFDPRRLHVARRANAVLESMSFRTRVAMPLLDASLVSS